MNSELRKSGHRLPGREHCLTQPRLSLRRCRRKRAGLLTAWSVFALALAMICTAFVVNHVWISGIRQDALHCAESAALAAAHGLLSDDLLRSQQQPFEQEWRNQRGREAAIEMSHRYQRFTRVPPLIADDVRLTSVSSATAERQAPPETASRPDRVEVNWRNSGYTSDSIPLFLPGLTGVAQAALGVSAAAALDNAPAAFRPSPVISVPVMPLAIPDDRGAAGAPTWSRLIERDQGSDLLTWNDDRRQVEPGADGLPEITLALAAGAVSGSPGTLVPLMFSGNRADPQVFRTWMTEGLRAADPTAGGITELQFPQDLSTADLAASDLPRLAEALLRLQGIARIYCLTEVPGQVIEGPGDDGEAAEDAEESREQGEDAATSVQGRTVRSIRPVAARIMQVRMTSADQLRVTLQPCIIVTSTAVPGRAETRANRYIYSIRLLR